MFESILKFFKKFGKGEGKEESGSKNKAKERLHLVLMQDRANVSADFLELMKQEIIDVIKKYIEVEESEIDVRLTNEVKEDGTTSAPSLYANIPILNIRNDMKKEVEEDKKQEDKKQEDKKQEDKKTDDKKETKVENKEDIEEVKDKVQEELKEQDDSTKVKEETKQEDVKED